MHQLNFDKIKSYTAYPDGGATIEYKGAKKKNIKLQSLGLPLKMEECFLNSIQP